MINFHFAVGCVLQANVVNVKFNALQASNLATEQVDP